MQQSNLKDPLIMKYIELQYEPVQTEGQCTLKTITPVRFNNIKFFLFCVLSIIFVGIPVVLAYWYPKLKLYLYYDQCSYKQSTHFSVLNYDDQIAIVEKKQEIYCSYQINQYQNQVLEEKITYFINRYMKYRIIQNETEFIVKVDLFDYQKQLIRLLQENYQKKQTIKGYQQTTVQQLRKRFGLGTMIIERPGLIVLFFRQIVQPLYFFLIASMIIWISENYYYYCAIIFISTAIGASLNLYQTYTLNNKIYSMAYYQVNVHVLRGNQVVNLSSKDIVPGDIVFLNQSMKIPFDGIILQNSALLDQSALTGQSVPVVRKAQDLDQFVKQLKKDKILLKSNILYQGNSLIQVDNKKIMQLFQKYRNEFGVPVFVIRTNFVTLKGQLIRMISFPIQKMNIFERQSAYFLLFLFFLACISYSLLVVRLYKYVQWQDMIQKFLDLVTVTVPPGLVVSMTFGIIHAVDKLKKKDIYCVSPNKVIMGGLVDLICFDKTGTLTQQYMDFKCLVPCLDGLFQNQIIKQQAGSQNVKSKYNNAKLLQKPLGIDLEHVLTNMAVNHTITTIFSTGENVGDPMQLSVFQFGQFRFRDQIAYQQNYIQKGEPFVFGFQNLKGHFGVALRRMEFDPQLFRMSAVAKSSIKQDPGSCYLYTKGSPESICKICNSLSLPKNYEQVLKYYASSGLRVLAICHKKIQPSQVNSDRMDIQKNMIFDGFLVFQNKLKPETSGALRELTIAQIPSVMITGDNSLTACSVAYKSGILSRKRQIYIFNYKKIEKKIQIELFKTNFTAQQIQESNQLQRLEQDEGPHQIQLKDLPYNQQVNSNQYFTQQNYQLLSDQQIVDQVLKKVLQKISNPYSRLCITGSTFYLLFGKIDLQKMDQSRKNILRSTKIFARAKPNQKARIIMAYQLGLDKIVSMCGDGANDCGALKQSDAGLSLSQTQASISAPFTSKVTNIGSMVQLIKQCRAGLITNISLFNIMALYSLIQYSTSVICQYYFTYLWDFQFLYLDLFGNFFFFIFFGYIQTADTLSKQKPVRSLFTVVNIIQVLIMHFIQLSGQFLMIFSLQNFFCDQIDYYNIGGSEVNYKKYVANGSNFDNKTLQCSVLFLFTTFFYIFSFIAFCISKPWRKPFYTCLPFMVVFIISFIYSTLLVIWPPSRIPIYEIIPQLDNHPQINIFILLTSLIFSTIMYVNQKFVLEPIGKKLRLKYPDKLWI